MKLKLTIHKETLRRLTNDHLRRVAGGDDPDLTVLYCPQPPIPSVHVCPPPNPSEIAELCVTKQPWKTGG